ncbi:hypothetical protein DFH07DRAFT_771876 [Mycena maculata]|uniref:Uncharacterized protein n=1 Tax=Mycena maculata TaxID=230809 RepID=A0AAD7JDK3_9AGAR|nr:hypothetical protein DFH07DRAFT_771876 [Mycena maculata]
MRRVGAVETNAGRVQNEDAMGTGYMSKRLRIQLEGRTSIAEQSVGGVSYATVGDERKTRGGDREVGPEPIIVGAQATKWDYGAAAAGWDSEQIRSCSEGLISLHTVDLLTSVQPTCNSKPVREFSYWLGIFRTNGKIPGLISDCTSGTPNGIERESTEQSLPACPSNGHPGVLDLDKECKTRREKTPTMI